MLIFLSWCGHIPFFVTLTIFLANFQPIIPCWCWILFLQHSGHERAQRWCCTPSKLLCTLEFCEGSWKGKHHQHHIICQNWQTFLCLGHSVSTNSSNCYLASSASSAVNHLSLHNRSRRPWNFIFDHSFSSTIEFGDKAEVFLTMLYLTGHLSCNFWIRTMMTCLHSLLKALFCSGLLSIKESDCFRAVPNLTCSASDY